MSVIPVNSEDVQHVPVPDGKWLRVTCTGGNCYHLGDDSVDSSDPYLADGESLVTGRDRFFVSAGSSTLSVTEEPKPDYGTEAIYPEDYGATGTGENTSPTDDTAAIQAAINAGMSSDSWKVVRLRATTYAVESAPDTTVGNSILVISDASSSTKSVGIEGVGGGGYWAGHKSILKTTRTGDSYTASTGPPVVLGGANVENESAINFAGTISLKNFRISVPEDPDIGGVDGIGWAGMDVQNVAVVAGDGTTDANYATNVNAIGFRGTTIFGGGIPRFQHAQVLQMYAGIVMYAPDHVVFDNTYTWRCQIGLATQDDRTGGNHGIAGGYFMSEQCGYAIGGWKADSGAVSLSADEDEVYLKNLVLDVEAGSGAFAITAVVLDANDIYYGHIDVHYWNGLAVANSGTFTGAANLDIRMARQPLVTITRNSAPTDGQVMTGQVVLWWDDSEGAPQLTGKGKDSAGTVFTSNIGTWA